MKFGKLLQEFQHGGEIPDCILDYKSLKKKLKAIKAQRESGTVSSRQHQLGGDHIWCRMQAL